jgi:hypothetical protein
MARKVEIVISIRLEEGRDVRETTLNDNVQAVSKTLIRTLADEGYGVVDADVEWSSIRVDRPSAVMGGKRKRYKLGKRTNVGRAIKES